ncbi:NAD(P)/FAD-dependent oxidoreductase [Candidatus Micrarchaeota archaeon]|nr:MAG: NAD(P)/FAD-dependent oxidoreductase [Candidatus Micrarchaeota archaeon]
MENNYDIIIIGGGPAALSAAVYVGRSKYRSLLIGFPKKSRIYGDYVVENYLGFASITGREFIDKAYAHARKFDTEFLEDEVIRVSGKGPFDVETASGKHFVSKALIIAVGLPKRRRVVKDEDKYKGKGLSSCAACDGYFFRDKKVIVVGNGNHAASEALELLHYTPNVKIYSNGLEIEIDKNLLGKLHKHNIEVEKKRITALKGQPMLTHVITEDGEEEVDGLFIATGQAASINMALDLSLDLDGNFIKVDKNCATNVDGVFAAGDCTGGILQIAQAVGDGAKAAVSALRFLRDKV